MTRRGTRALRHSPASRRSHATIGGVSRTPSAPSGPATAGSSGRTAVLVLVAAVLVAMLALPVRSWFVQQARIAEVEGQLSSTETAVEDLQTERRNWQNEAFVEQQARLRLNYVRPGEVGIVVLQHEGATASTQQPATWYEGLWQTVESASGRGETAMGEPVQVRDSAPR